MPLSGTVPTSTIRENKNEVADVQVLTLVILPFLKVLSFFVVCCPVEIKTRIEDHCGEMKRGHTLNQTSSGEACMVALKLRDLK